MTRYSSGGKPPPRATQKRDPWKRRSRHPPLFPPAYPLSPNPHFPVRKIKKTFFSHPINHLPQFCPHPANPPPHTQTVKHKSWNKQNKPQTTATGPTSDAGKQIASRNAIKHGCCSEATLILPHENKEEFASLQSSWLRTYKPTDDSEAHLVLQLIHADWFYQRATRAAADVEAKLYLASPEILNWTEQQHQSLGRFLRYQTTRANQLAKCRKALEDFRKNRAAKPTAKNASPSLRPASRFIRKRINPNRRSIN